LRTLGMGSIVGELGVCGGARATASVIATRESKIYYLSRDRLRQIEENDLEMAADLHRSIARLLGERLADAMRTIEALLEHEAGSCLYSRNPIIFRRTSASSS
jgi:CRP-like cAMP-binding protein